MCNIELLACNNFPDILTVLKCQDFSVTQILREINFGVSRSSKTAVFAILEALNLVELVYFSLQEVYKFIRIKTQNLSRVNVTKKW